MKHALIMAAGRGSRMKPLTDIIPKPMAKIEDKTLLELGIDNIKNYVSNIHITVGYKGTVLAHHAIECGISSIINTNGQESCWWIFNSLATNINDGILVLTCDNLFVMDISDIETEYNRLNKPACMIVPTTKKIGFDGDFIHHNSNNAITSINRDVQSDMICSGIQILNPFKINKILYNANNFYEIWTRLIQNNELKISSVRPNEWVAIDTIEQLQNFNSFKK